MITAGMAGESYDIGDPHSRWGVAASFGLALAVICVLPDAFSGLVYSQICLSAQLPFTMLSLVLLTGSRRVMGRHANSRLNGITLWTLTLVVIVLNIAMLASL